MTKKVKINLTNPIIRLPQKFLQQFQTHKNKKYLNAELDYYTDGDKNFFIFINEDFKQQIKEK